MKCNVGGIDMALRLIVGAVLLVIGFAVPLSAVAQTVVFVVAGIALVTGLVRYCPLNQLLGLNTCQHKGHHDKEVTS